LTARVSEHVLGDEVSETFAAEHVDENTDPDSSTLGLSGKRIEHVAG
jgi:hypothetical protein